MRRQRKFKYDSEAEMCACFVERAQDDPIAANHWTAYAETAGYDLVMVRADGVQVGIEAKQTLNAKVLAQIVGDGRGDMPGPDYRAVLTPFGYNVAGVEELARHCGVTVIRALGPNRHGQHNFTPSLPRAVNNAGRRVSMNWEYRHCQDWKPWYPAQRLELPDYVPDVAAGVKAPVSLSLWKVKALKVLCILAHRSFITRSDFRYLDLSPTVWMQRGWLVPTAKRGVYAAGALPDFVSQHPEVYAEIEADLENWAPESVLNDIAEKIYCQRN